MNEIADRLRVFRKEKNLTQIEVADKIGVKKGTYANWETGKRKPKFETVAKLAKALGVRVTDLLGNEALEYVEDEEAGVRLLQVPEEVFTYALNKDEEEETFVQNLRLLFEMQKNKFNKTDDEIEFLKDKAFFHLKK